jgi:Fur family transcriptional regulator, ferric uptake regulator
MQKKANKQLMNYLANRGLRSTSQRGKILSVFIEAGRHISAEELYDQVKRAYPGIGYATVYRTLKLLSGAGLAEERRFDDGFTRFEYRTSKDHHDHFICTHCGVIIEFENERIEALQQYVARQKGFTVHNHKLELYGLCSECRKKNHHKIGTSPA